MRKSLRVSTGFVILVGILGLVTPFQGWTQGRDGPAVTVVNTAAQPVPTAAQGTTNVQGAVSITGTPNVNVTNTPTVRTLDNPATQPVS